MRKRLRKKKRLGEFQEFGFNVSFTGPAIEQADIFLDAFIAFVESNNFHIGGGWDRNGASFYVTRAPRKSCLESDRFAIENWLKVQSDISDVNVSKLTDAWYGPF